MERWFRLLSRTLFSSMRLLPLELLLELPSSPLPVSSPRWVPGWSPSCRSWCAGMAAIAVTGSATAVAPARTAAIRTVPRCALPVRIRRASRRVAINVKYRQRISPFALAAQCFWRKRRIQTGRRSRRIHGDLGGLHRDPDLAAGGEPEVGDRRRGDLGDDRQRPADPHPDAVPPDAA